MDKPQPNLIQSLLALVFMVAVVGAIIWVGARVFSAIPQELLVAAITLSGGIIVAVIQWVQAKDRQIQQEIRKHKTRVYEEFIGFWIKSVFLKSVIEKPEANEEERKISGALAEFTHKVIVWGSDDVLKEYSIFKRGFNPPNEGGKERASPAMETMFAFEKLMLAMRADIGHANKGLNKGDLLALFVLDIEKYI